MSDKEMRVALEDAIRNGLISKEEVGQVIECLNSYCNNWMLNPQPPQRRPDDQGDS